MADAVNSVTSAAGGAALRSVVAPVQAAPAAQAQASSSPSSTAQIQPISPTIKTDPMSGIQITEYLGDTGQVQMQIPSAVAVAYLRVGLTATGEPKPKEGSDTGSVVA